MSQKHLIEIPSNFTQTCQMTYAFCIPFSYILKSFPAVRFMREFESRAYFFETPCIVSYTPQLMHCISSCDFRNMYAHAIEELNEILTKVYTQKNDMD